MRYRFLKNLLKGVRHTCLHPQWFVYKGNQGHFQEIGKKVTGRVLDIGCADQFMKQYLSDGSVYIGLDYYQTATEWYQTKPNIFGDAQCLPFADSTMDSVLLLDVLEHIPEPDHCMMEIARVLKDKGLLVLQVPFLYPIHDAPLDFQRWTSYGLCRLAKKNGFTVREERLLGKSVETAGLMFNLALCKLLLNWGKRKSPALILSVIILPVVALVNVLCWLLALISHDDNFMPHGYRLVLEKQSCAT